MVWGSLTQDGQGGLVEIGVEQAERQPRASSERTEPTTKSFNLTVAGYAPLLG